MDKFNRFEMQIGKTNLANLKKAHVAIFGIGGVGSYVAEALARCGIGEFSLIDNDIVCISNFNRQIIATSDNISKTKVEAMEKRIHLINEVAIVHTYNMLFTSENKDEFPFEKFDYIVDAIDMVTSKIILIECAKKFNKKIICSMGTANKINPMGFIVDDISKTSVDPLARVMRYELKKRNICDVKVIYSKEIPLESINVDDSHCPYSGICKEKCQSHTSKKIIPSSNSFVPSSAGLLIASEVIKDLINQNN